MSDYAAQLVLVVCAAAGAALFAVAFLPWAAQDCFYPARTVEQSVARTC